MGDIVPVGNISAWPVVHICPSWIVYCSVFTPASYSLKFKVWGEFHFEKYAVQILDIVKKKTASRPLPAIFSLSQMTFPLLYDLKGGSSPDKGTSEVPKWFAQPLKRFERNCLFQLFRWQDVDWAPRLGMSRTERPSSLAKLPSSAFPLLFVYFLHSGVGRLQTWYLSQASEAKLVKKVNTWVKFYFLRGFWSSSYHIGFLVIFSDNDKFLDVRK